MSRMLLKITGILEFILFYVIKVIQANFELSYHILLPKLRMTPGILKIPVSLAGEQSLLLLINLISMTPGTLSIDLTEDRRYIFVHALFIKDREKTIKEIKKLENKIHKLFN